jgi:two-component system phosphate regulon sensor histidine kinase PhoR
MPNAAKYYSGRIFALRDSSFFYAQIALLGSLAIVAASAGQDRDDPTYGAVLILVVVLILGSLAALIPPWARLRRDWLIVWGVFDIAIVATLRTDLAGQQPALTVLALIPVLWLSYSFGVVAMIVASVGAYVVALAPYILGGSWPTNPGAWGAATLIPAIIGVAALAIYFAAVRLRRQRIHLLTAYEELRVSVERGLDADSAAVAVVNSVDAGIEVYSPDGTILLTNETARALAKLGGGADSASNKHSLMPYLFEADRVTPVAPENSIAAMAARGELVSRRTLWVGVGEQQRAVLVTTQHVRREFGELIGTVVVTHDVTELARAIRSRDEFLTTVSHELRTPMTSIIGYLEVIEDSVDITAPGLAHAFATVNRNTQRLLSLINALLAEAEGYVTTERRLVDIADLATRSVSAMGPAAIAAGVQVNTPELSHVHAEVDATSIGEVIDRLLSNAIKFSVKGGIVSLSVQRRKDEVVVRVVDTGVGISAEDERHIFDRFFRGTNARTAVVAGTGLGLSKAKGIVDSHHGVISVHSRLSRGTTMEMRLPLKAAT